MPDYIMRWLASRFLDADIQEELGILTAEVRARKKAQDVAMSVDVIGHGEPGQRRRRRAATAAADGAAEAVPAASRRSPTRRRSSRPGMNGLDLGPACSQCGGMMQRTGSCYTCSCCGNNTGCG